MIAGQRPKPARLRVVQGNPGKRPINAGEPQSEPLTGPPKDMSAQHKAIWRQLVQAAPPHVLKQADRFLVELTVLLLAQARASGADVSPGIATQLRQCLAEMGMSPSARSRLSVSEPAAANPFEGL
jgi:phage terminase small subunit